MGSGSACMERTGTSRSFIRRPLIKRCSGSWSLAAGPIPGPSTGAAPLRTVGYDRKANVTVCLFMKGQRGQRNGSHGGAGIGGPGQQPDVVPAGRDQGEVELGLARGGKIHRFLRAPARMATATEPYGCPQLLIGSSPANGEAQADRGPSSADGAGISFPAAMRCALTP